MLLCTAVQCSCVHRSLAAGKLVIKLGDKEVEWDPNFRLYMTSKQSNPHYGPEVSGKTMIINYSVTQQGLTEQLLNVTVKHERWVAACGCEAMWGARATLLCLLGFRA
jgi:hypothetical protein